MQTAGENSGSPVEALHVDRVGRGSERGRLVPRHDVQTSPGSRYPQEVGIGKGMNGLSEAL